MWCRRVPLHRSPSIGFLLPPPFTRVLCVQAVRLCERSTLATAIHVSPSIPLCLRWCFELPLRVVFLVGFGSSSLTDDSLTAIASNCRQLQVLNLQGASAITDEGTIKLVESTRLVKLNIGKFAPCKSVARSHCYAVPRLSLCRRLCEAHRALAFSIIASAYRTARITRRRDSSLLSNSSVRAFVRCCDGLCGRSLDFDFAVDAAPRPARLSQHNGAVVGAHRARVSIAEDVGRRCVCENRRKRIGKDATSA